MVVTALTIEREIEDARSTRDASVSGKRKDSQSFPVQGRGREPLVREDLRVTAIRVRDR